jgi:hypothetical protein
MSQTGNRSGDNFDALFHKHTDTEQAFHMSFGKGRVMYVFMPLTALR